MDINLNPKKYNVGGKKGGDQGNKMWTSHRVEPSRSRSAKSVKKPKRSQGK